MKKYSDEDRKKGDRFEDWRKMIADKIRSMSRDEIIAYFKLEGTEEEFEDQLDGYTMKDAPLDLLRETFLEVWDEFSESGYNFLKGFSLKKGTKLFRKKGERTSVFNIVQEILEG